MEEIELKNIEFYEETEFKETEIGPLPKDWGVVRFDKAIINKSIKIKNVKKSYYKKIGKYPIVDQGQDIIAGYCDNEEKVYKEELPVIIFGDHTRIIKFIDYPFVCGADGTKIIIPDKNKFIVKYFYYSLLNIDIPSRGYNRHYLILKEKFIPLPPISEQQKIAAVLSAIQEAKEKTERVIEATKNLKKSLMKHLFTYGPVPLSDIDKVELKETEIGPLPTHWQVVRLGEVIINNNKFKFLNDIDEYIPFIPMELIPEENLYIQNWILKKKSIIKSGVKIFEGDLLVAKITPCFENGKQGIVKGLPKSYGFATTEIIPIRTKDNLLSEFIANYLKLPDIRKNLASKMEGTTGRQRLSKSQLFNLLIPLPPLSEQQKIAEILSSVDEKIQKEEERKRALENLFKSMLHNLMTGKIRVRSLNSKG